MKHGKGKFFEALRRFPPCQLAKRTDTWLEKAPRTTMWLVANDTELCVASFVGPGCSRVNRDAGIRMVEYQNRVAYWWGVYTRWKKEFEESNNGPSKAVVGARAGDH